MTPLIGSLFDSVEAQIDAIGFKAKKAKSRFIRKREGITDQFYLTRSFYLDYYCICPSIGIRIEQVEKIFHQTSGVEKKHQGNNSTMGAEVGDLMGGRSLDCQYILKNEEGIPAVVEQVVSVFQNFALPFYERWSSLAAIDSELNDDPSRKTIYRGMNWDRCSTGAIVARLTGRPDYEKIAAFYTEVMKKDNRGFYFKYFESLLKSLEAVAPGSGINQ